MTDRKLLEEIKASVQSFNLTKEELQALVEYVKTYEHGVTPL